MAVEVMRTMASVGSMMEGSGTLSHRMSWMPCQARAFMVSGLVGGEAAGAEHRERGDGEADAYPAQRPHQAPAVVDAPLGVQVPPRGAGGRKGDADGRFRVEGPRSLRLGGGHASSLRSAPPAAPASR